MFVLLLKMDGLCWWIIVGRCGKVINCKCCIIEVMYRFLERVMFLVILLNFFFVWFIICLIIYSEV